MSHHATTPHHTTLSLSSAHTLSLFPAHTPLARRLIKVEVEVKDLEQLRGIFREFAPQVVDSSSRRRRRRGGGRRHRSSRSRSRISWSSRSNSSNEDTHRLPCWRYAIV